MYAEALIESGGLVEKHWWHLQRTLKQGNGDASTMQKMEYRQNILGLVPQMMWNVSSAYLGILLVKILL